MDLFLKSDPLKSALATCCTSVTETGADLDSPQMFSNNLSKMTLLVVDDDTDGNRCIIPLSLSPVCCFSLRVVFQVHAIVSLICTCTPNLANDFNLCCLGCLSCMVQVENWSLTHDENPMHKDFPPHCFASRYCLGLNKAGGWWAWFVYATFL